MVVGCGMWDMGYGICIKMWVVGGVFLVVGGRYGLLCSIHVRILTDE